MSLNNKVIIALALVSSVLSGAALAQGTTEANATVINSLPATFAVAIDGFAETPSSNVCSQDFNHSFFYKYTTGATPESVTFFAIGEDTEFVMYEQGATNGAACFGGDDDNNPSFADVGITAPAPFDGVDTSNSEIFTETLSASTTYILQVGLNRPLDSDTLPCIVFGIYDSQGQAANISGGICGQSQSPPLSVNSLSLGGLLVLISLIMGAMVFVVRGRM